MARGYRFSGVQFAYDEHPIIDELDLLFPREDNYSCRTFGIGENYYTPPLAGFAHPQQGAISLGNLNLQDAELKAYRRNLAEVQQPLLFTSFAGNVALGSTPDLSKVSEALEAAYCTEFAGIGPKANLSVKVNPTGGGQRQRLSIARILCHQLLLLDEATAALDNESKRGYNRRLKG